MRRSKIKTGSMLFWASVQYLCAAPILALFGLLTPIALLIVLIDAGDMLDTLLLCLLMDALGLYLLRSGQKKTALVKKCDVYMENLPQVPNGHIPELAAVLGKTEEEVRQDMDALLGKGLVEGIYLDWNTNCIITLSGAPAAAPEQDTEPEQCVRAEEKPGEPEVELVTVKCACCGGLNAVPRGARGECEYCGSEISAE